MKLKTKVLSLLFAVFALYLAADYGIQKSVVYPSFLALERKEAITDVKRSVEALQREIHFLDFLVWDWASWDDTYEFINTRSKAYIDANLIEETFTDDDLNVLYFIDTSGKVIWGETRDRQMEITHLPEFPEEALPANHPLLLYEAENKPLEQVKISGVYKTRKGPMLISSRPILTSQSDGPARGSVIMAKYLTDKIIKKLVEQTQVDFKIFPIMDGALPEPLKDIPGRITDESRYLVEAADSDYLDVYTTVPDIKGDAVMLITTKIPRDISAQGSATMRYALYSTMAAGVGVLLIMLLLLQRTILKPVTALTQHTLAVGKNADLSSRLDLQRKDEIGTLANEFDKMLAQLAEARKKLTEQIYMAGMAEMASGVLHNVRNSLTPLVGDLQLLRGKFKKAPLKETEAALTELDEGVASDVRRDDLIRFSHLANKSLTSLIHDSDLKLSGAMEQIGHIEKTLDDHQKWAAQDNVSEQIDLNELVHDSIKSIEKQCKGFVSIDTDPELPEVGSVVGNPITLKQVFHNLIINAVESLQRKGEEHGKILIRATIENKDGNEVKHVQFEDNGEGIEPEALKQVFARGYSTKEKAGSGIGLHWCANAVTAFNGKLYAESEGRGTGACFHLELPDKT